MKKRMLPIILSLFMFVVLLPLNSLKVSAATNYIFIKGKNKSLVGKTTVVYVGEKSLKLGYKINGKTRGITGSFGSSNSDVIKVSKSGVLKAVDNGTATISFSYGRGRRKNVIKCKFKAETKAGDVSLSDKYGNMDNVKIDAGKTLKFEAQVNPTEKALSVNEYIRSTYKVYYDLYSDESCETESDAGTVSGKGVVKAGDEAGVMYLRAVAKASKNSNKGAVYSNVVKIEITGSKKTDIKEEDKDNKGKDEKDKDKNNVPADLEKLKPARIEISQDVPLVNYAPVNGIVYADIKYRLYDGNGKEITNSSEVYAAGFSVIWEGQSAAVLSPGNGRIAMLANKPTIGVSGNIKVTYSEAGRTAITAEAKGTVVPPSIVTKAEFKGIYKAVYNTTSAAIVYEPVLEGDKAVIKAGDEITDFGSIAMLNSVNKSYYMLIDAEDNYGNRVVEAETPTSKIKVEVTGNPSIAIDTVLVNGTEVNESIKPIVVDGKAYLTYPLKPGKVIVGDMEIIITGGGVRTSVKKRITDGSVLRLFFVTSSGTYMGQDNILEYSLFSSKGEQIKEYSAFLYLLGIDDPNNSGNIFLPYDSKIISSSKGSVFTIRKNPTTKEAEIHYNPSFNTLTMNPNGTVSDIGQDEVTVLKGYGAELERTIPIVVYKKRQ